MHDFLAFMREQEERDKQHELDVMKLLTSQSTQVPIMNQPYCSSYMMSAPLHQYANSFQARVNVQSNTVKEESTESCMKQFNVDEKDDSNKTFMSL